MRQLLQAYKSGEVVLAEVPVPAVRPGGVLVRTCASLVSAGTELSLLRESQSSLLERARRRPEAVKQLIRTARREGIQRTLDRVQDRLSDLIAMGYSCSGRVVAVGPGVTDLRVGQAVACAGVGYACHGEVNFVPRNLCNPIPEKVGFDEAAFVALGAIAAQGVRQAEVRFGDVVAVMGLGLVGQITVQILIAAGCTVIGTDLMRDKCRLAAEYGARAVGPGEFASTVMAASDGHGADAVIVTASSQSSEVITGAAHASRMRGKVVIVGAVGMDLPRGPFYSKELDIRFSMSYGPGRYDPRYEENGLDYPYDLVRWTEGRNMKAVLDLVAAGKLDLKALVTHRYSLDDAPDAYAMMSDGAESYLGILISYPRSTEEVLARQRVDLTGEGTAPAATGEVRLGMLGAGEYARATLLPAMRACRNARLVGLATATGRSALTAGKRYGFAYCTCDESEVLKDPNVDAVVIATRHDVHARQVVDAMKAGKHVLVEKPLGLSTDQLRQIEQAYRAAGGRCHLLVGHNRRFSRAMQELRRLFAHRGTPMVVNYRVNAGGMPATHWTRSQEGGGRWLGEGSHFVDFACALCGDVPTEVFAARTVGGTAAPRGDSWNVTLRFADSSVATISYCDLGHAAAGKERCEVFADGKTAVLDDWERLELYEGAKPRTVRLADKGHDAEVAAFCATVGEGKPLGVSFDEQLGVAWATLAAAVSAEQGRSVSVAGVRSGSIGSEQNIVCEASEVDH